ncbi:DUF6519 domain-containing protein [Geodermatophilus sp. SYSU D00758]
MYGDYSRGHEPDRARGERYHRVLMQMGRPVLDSDVAALVDAVLDEVRTTTRGLGGAAGSPDLGFLVTPGRPLAVFAEAAAGLRVVGGQPDVGIDHRFRLAGRYPALYVAAGGARVRLTVPLLQPAVPVGGATRLAVWARVETSTRISVAGAGLDLVPGAPDDLQRVELDPILPLTGSVDLEVDAGGRVWLFLLEQHQPAGAAPTFWTAPGTYHVDGLVARTAGGPFPPVAFPTAVGFAWDAADAAPPLAGLVAPPPLREGEPLVAYLEVWERHISGVEAPGIVERALGPADTTARTALLGQVKLATVTGALPEVAERAAAVVRSAFAAASERSAGELVVNVSEAAPINDPCALPDLAGYSGADNRLYRVEVHRGGDLSRVGLKWSRDNGAELFAARLGDDRNLVFPAGTPLVAGDIVEVRSHVTDLGDDALATVDPAGPSFTPAGRAVGQLAALVAVSVASSSDEVVFGLVDPVDRTTPVPIDDRYGTLPPNGPDAVLKLRRWHGVLAPNGTTGPHALEDGLTVELSATGTYRPGDYWQYEARAGGGNANGPWRAAPHGPQRRFAPLALLAHRAADRPLDLLAWLDRRFPALCDIDADAVAFDGHRVDSASTTVQEAIEQLFERPVGSGCGELVVQAGGREEVQAAFDAVGAGQAARICFPAGTWELDATVRVVGKGDLLITGAGPDATRLVGARLDAVLRFEECGRVRIADLYVEGGQQGLVGDGLTGALSVVDCAAADLERVAAHCGDASTRRVSAVELRVDPPTSRVPPPPFGVRVRDCTLQAGSSQVGLLVVNPTTADIEGNTVVSPQRPATVADLLAEPEIVGRFGHLLISDLRFGETEEANDELLVGSPDVVVELVGAGSRRRFAVHLEPWGFEWITFSTTLRLNGDQWQRLLEDNPIVTGNTSVTTAFIAPRLRRFRRELVKRMFRQATSITVASDVSDMLTAEGDRFAETSTFTAGGQGIVVAGTATSIGEKFRETAELVGEPRPDARVVGNRVVGFREGITVAGSRHTFRGVSYRVTLLDNLVHLRVPGVPAQRHGIRVGNCHHLRVEGNTVELRAPGRQFWERVPAIDAIVAHGMFGPLLQISENSAIGTRRAVVAFAENPERSPTSGWRWRVEHNALLTVGREAVAETKNWE